MAGFTADPDALEQAAALLDQAAGETEIAGERIGEGMVAAESFGRTEQAKEVAATWGTAVRARVGETTFTARETRARARELRTAAAEYRKLDDHNTERFGE